MLYALYGKRLNFVEDCGEDGGLGSDCVWIKLIKVKIKGMAKVNTKIMAAY